MFPFLAHALAHNWFHLLPMPWASIALALVAVLCGGIVGGERARREKPAGLRTLMLVSLGSATFTMAGFAFTSSTGDSGRVAAQIVTGIGFLGAGVILHGRGTVSGTTTAATIWVTAAIGMTAATGYAGAALGLSALVRTILFGIRRLEVHHLGGYVAQQVTVDCLIDGGKTRVRIERVLADYWTSSVEHEWAPIDAERMRLSLRVRLPQMHSHELLAELADIPQVMSIEVAG